VYNVVISMSVRTEGDFLDAGDPGEEGLTAEEAAAISAEEQLAAVAAAAAEEEAEAADNLDVE
jgi:hypothetical protein